MAPVRDPFFDIAKAFTMLMVVFGHVSDAANVFQGWMYNIGIGFKMPMFFLISGYFLNSVVERHDWRRLLFHIKSYFLPLAWISSTFALISFSLGSIDRSCLSMVSWALRFFCGQWFVWALAATYVLVFLACLLGRSFGCRLCLMLIVCCLFMSVPCPYAREMMPYFIVGLTIRHFSIAPWERRWVGLGCMIVFVVGTYVAGDVKNNGLAFYFTDTSIKVFFSIGGLGLWLGRHLLGICGSVGVLFLIQHLLRHYQWMARFSVFGTTTLGVYYLHQQILKVFEHGVRLSGNEGLVIAVSLLLFLCTHCVVWLSRERTVILRRIIWGLPAMASSRKGDIR